MAERLETDVLVVGAGVIGLASAARLADNRSLIVIEANSQFGQGTSSRNSEVVHSGIYYPKDSNKTAWCIEGRKRLYEFCRTHNVPILNCGKILVATKPEEEGYLETLSQHCSEVDVPLERLTKSEIKKKEPLISASHGLFFPESGVVDSHQLMAAFERQIEEAGGLIAYSHRLMSLHQTEGKWLAQVKDPSGNDLEITAPQVVNASGLASAEWASSSHNEETFSHRYCRGRYMTLGARFRKKFQRLIYPVPQKDGLGVHVTIDLEGMARLGPDVDWSDDHSYANHAKLYQCDWDAIADNFVQSVQKYCPSVTKDDVSPGLIGIRPKLFIDDEAHKDFVIHNQDALISCLGIESPGLTAALAIAERVAAQVE